MSSNGFDEFQGHYSKQDSPLNGYGLSANYNEEVNDINNLQKNYREKTQKYRV